MTSTILISPPLNHKLSIRLYHLASSDLCSAQTNNLQQGLARYDEHMFSSLISNILGTAGLGNRYDIVGACGRSGGWSVDADGTQAVWDWSYQCKWDWRIVYWRLILRGAVENWDTEITSKFDRIVIINIPHHWYEHLTNLVPSYQHHYNEIQTGNLMKWDSEECSCKE